MPVNYEQVKRLTSRLLARAAQLRYNYAMVQWRSHSLRIGLTLILAVVATAVLWPGTVLPAGGHSSVLPTPTNSVASPLPTPTLTPVPAPSSWATGGMALLWFMLGILLALGLALVVLRWHHRVVQ